MPLLAVLAVLAVGAAAVVGWLARPLTLDPGRRAKLADAVGAVDRELAANLELLSMVDQTHQPVVLENGEFARHRATLEEAARAAAGAVAELYSRIPAAESAMERRGPAQTMKTEDRLLIEAWEGDAREAQRALRASLAARPRARWQVAIARLHGRSPQR